MPKPIKRAELIRRLRALGWEGLFKAGVRLTIPNPHADDIDWSLTKRILQQAQITPEQWDAF